MSNEIQISGEAKIETIQTASPSLDQLDPESAILAKLPTLEGQFGKKPENVRDLYYGFAAFAKEKLDPSDTASNYVELGRLQYNIQTAEFNIPGVSYSRATVSENVKLSARIAGVPETLNKPHEFAQAFWLSKLDRSTPGVNPGEPRTWSADPTPSEWFAGNVSYGTLRKLFPTMKRESGDTELDCWEFHDGWEAWVRGILDRLRKGQLSATKVDALYRDKKSAMDRAEKEAKRAGLTQEQIKALEANEKNADRQKKLAKLSEDVVNLSKDAITSVGYGKNELKRFMVDKGVIDPDSILNGASIDALASKMQPGDGRTLILALVSTGRNDIVNEIGREIANQIRLAKEKTEDVATLPMTKSA